MVKLTKIYTRTGDDGTTGLADGTRRAKHDLRIACYGTIDEANAALGLARTALEENPELSGVILRLQNDFDLGADLATPDPDMEGALRITDDQVARLEKEIDTLNTTLVALESFILPGGTKRQRPICILPAPLRGARSANYVPRLPKATPPFRIPPDSF